MALVQKQALQILDQAGTGKANMTVLDMGQIKGLINAPLMNDIGMFPFATGLTFDKASVRSNGTIRYAFDVTNGIWKDKTVAGPVAAEKLKFEEDIIVWENPKGLAFDVLQWDMAKGFQGAPAIALANFIVSRQNDFLRDLAAVFEGRKTPTGAAGEAAGTGNATALTATDFNVGATATNRQIGEAIWVKIGDEVTKYAYSEKTINGKKLTLGKGQVVVILSEPAFNKLVLSGIVGNNAEQAFSAGSNYVGNVAGYNIFVNPFQTNDIILANNMVVSADLDIYYAEIGRIPNSPDVKITAEAAQYIHKTKFFGTDTVVAFNHKLA